MSDAVGNLFSYHNGNASIVDGFGIDHQEPVISFGICQSGVWVCTTKKLIIYLSENGEYITKPITGAFSGPGCFTGAFCVQGGDSDCIVINTEDSIVGVFVKGGEFQDWSIPQSVFLMSGLSNAKGYTFWGMTHRLMDDDDEVLDWGSPVVLSLNLTDMDWECRGLEIDDFYGLDNSVMKRYVNLPTNSPLVESVVDIFNEDDNTVMISPMLTKSIQFSSPFVVNQPSKRDFDSWLIMKYVNDEFQVVDMISDFTYVGTLIVKQKNWSYFVESTNDGLGKKVKVYVDRLSSNASDPFEGVIHGVDDDRGIMDISLYFDEVNGFFGSITYRTNILKGVTEPLSCLLVSDDGIDWCQKKRLN